MAQRYNTNALSLKVEETLFDLVGDSGSDLMDDFEMGIGRLVWREILRAWLLPVTFILEKDKCNSFGLFLLSPTDAALVLGIKEGILTDWMTMMVAGIGPGYSTPWAMDSD